MTDPVDDQPNRTKVRVGLAIITLVVLVAVVLAVVIEDPLGKAVMIGVAAVGLVRAFLLTRSLRSEAS